jgi:hypothetical protein
VPIIGSVPRDANESLAQLLQDGDDSVAALAAYHSIALGDPSLIEAAGDVLEVRPALRYVADAAHQLREAGHG